jgi:hypothetical protein
MPGATIWIGIRIRRLGQRLMDLPAVGHRGRPVCRRTQQRMTEPHPSTETDQPFGLGRRRGVDPDSEPSGRPPQQRHVADRLRRRRQQQSSCVGRHRLKLPHEALLDPVRQRHDVRKAEPAGKLRRGQAARQLEQGERVAVRLRDDPVGDAVVQTPGNGGVQQRRGVALAQPAHGELGQSREILCRTRLAHHEDQADRLRQETARNERQRLRRSAVLPLRVIHRADEGPLLRHVGQQAQRRQSDEKAVRGLAGAQPERRRQRIALRSRQAIETIEHGRAELMQARERELHLGLHSGGSRDATPRRTLDEIREQCGLADPRLATDDQHRALPGAHGRHEAIQRLALAPAPE